MESHTNNDLLFLLIISISMVSYCSSTIYYLDDPNIYNSPPSSSNPHRTSRNLVSSGRGNLVSATEDMLRADYFTFVTLINMSPPGLFQGDVTFLMPDDRALAGVTGMSPESVGGLLLRHSIPSPLLFETLRLFPSGSLLPSSDRNYTLTVNDNNGRGSYVINNARIVGPNICSHVGSTVRCHGIDSVLSEDILC